jgi:cytochrome c peroxidase
MMQRVAWLTVGMVWVVMNGPVFAHGIPPSSLQGVKLPKVPQLRHFVTDRQAAIQLGKALFWDANVGSDGMACASCHFHAGADHRIHNQLEPGDRHAGSVTASRFERLPSGQPGGPNARLRANDFPLWQFADPNDRESAVIFQTDDLVGSAGVFKQRFQTIDGRGGLDACEPQSDDIYHLGHRNTRRVTDRNAPTVINAAFNFRQFWDGRANNAFNGESSWGARDPDAGVWIVKHGKPLKQRILLKNAALASQAVSPPVNEMEMSCGGRRLPDLGRKLLFRRALQNQSVHVEDSVLGRWVDASGKGLQSTYASLIRLAFAKRYWDSVGEFGLSADGKPYSQMEANFGLFFGLAIQLYEETLISDQSKFDSKRDKENVPVAFTAQEKRGLTLFMNDHCFLCHLGPALTSATHPQVYNTQSTKYLKLLDRSGFNEEGDGVGVARTLVDVGYTITSVTPIDHDVGVAGEDPWGHPLSFSRQYLDMMQDPTLTMVDNVDVLSCEFSIPFTTDFNRAELVPDLKARRRCQGFEELAQRVKPDVVQAELAQPFQGRLGASISAAFKIPTLRNVELTGPYMHNGSMKSLEEVVQFYNRGGNQVGNPHHFETVVFPFGMSAQDQADLIAFLKTLTDERVRWEKAPFDHPEIRIPHGHLDQSSSLLGDQNAEDDYLIIPAVGRNGRSLEQGPLQSFEQALSH